MPYEVAASCICKICNNWSHWWTSCNGSSYW